jgi:hypothetical protein
MPYIPQPLLQWPSNGISRTSEDVLATTEETIYYVREKNFGNPGRTLGPYHALDRLKIGCEDVIKHRCLGLTLDGLRNFLEPLVLWELADFAIAPTSIFIEKTMPYDIVAQPNNEVASALQSLPQDRTLPLYAVKVARADPPFVQKRDDLNKQIPELIENDKIWGISTVHLNMDSANEYARLLFQHLFTEIGDVMWLDYTGKVTGEGLFAGIILGNEEEVRAIVHVRCQNAP